MIGTSGESSDTAAAMFEGVALVLVEVIRRGQPNLARDIACDLGLNLEDLVSVADPGDVADLQRALVI